MITEYGDITFRYVPEEKGMRYEITLPEGMGGQFLRADNTAVELKTGKNMRDKNRRRKIICRIRFSVII